jgi:hypothetical protein
MKSLIAIFSTMTAVHAFLPAIKRTYCGRAHHTNRPKTPSQLFLSDIPRDDSNSPFDNFRWKDLLPPPPEDEFILTGDIMSLFMYAFTSHFLNNYIVQSVLATSETLNDAVDKLDPMREVVNMQVPVWVDQTSSQLTDQVLSMNVQQSLMNHWGPLYTTAGIACVALCSCWLVAGWLHNAFLFRNTLECNTERALKKTIETWLTMTVLMCLLTVVSNTAVSHIPLLQSWLGCASCQGYILTKADAFFLVDSLTVLMTWRFTASYFFGYGK